MIVLKLLHLDKRVPWQRWKTDGYFIRKLSGNLCPDRHPVHCANNNIQKSTTNKKYLSGRNIFLRYTSFKMWYVAPCHNLSFLHMNLSDFLSSLFVWSCKYLHSRLSNIYGNSPIALHVCVVFALLLIVYYKDIILFHWNGRHTGLMQVPTAALTLAWYDYTQNETHEHPSNVLRHHWEHHSKSLNISDISSYTNFLFFINTKWS